MSVAAVIVAAGNSRRMGFNKLLAPLAGRPVLAWTIDAFQRCEEIDEIVVVGGDEVAEAARNAGAPKLSQVVEGGSERHFSVWAGLQAVGAGVRLVAVHDGGRPLVTPGQITRCVEAARLHRAVTCARRATETMKRCDAEGRITGSIERENAWVMETPQVFELELLRRAYQQVLADGLLVTDEVSAVQHLGETVRVVENAEPNLKITFPADIPVAENLMRVRASH